MFILFIFFFYRDLHMYKAVLIVPDIYNRGHLRELMNLLLLKMGFSSCFLVQVKHDADLQMISLNSNQFFLSFLRNINRITLQQHLVLALDMRAW